MKYKIGVAAVLMLLAVTAATTPQPAGAACPPPDSCASCPVLIQFDANCFAYETSYTKATFNSAPGSQMTVVGLIVSFGTPLNGLNNVADPNKEYTFVMSGLVSRGTLVSTNGPTTLYDCDYDSSSGSPVFTIYEGTPRNSPSTPAAWAANPFGGAVVPANHQDGTAILSGTLCGFHTAISKTGLIVGGSFRATYEFTGGTQYSAVGNGKSIVGGNWCPTSGGCTPANYTAHPNGKFDASATTPARRSTWGLIKSLYR